MAGGNWIIDQIKVIDRYPEEEKLSNIVTEYTGNGGAPFNVLTALYNMNASVPLRAIGVLGEDDRGDMILQECRKMGIDARQLTKLSGADTSYTDVMTATETGKRTFFHYRGANALLEEEHFDFSRANVRIFHLGYLLLLDRLDEVTDGGLTGAARVLKSAKEAGLMTSADLVSEQSNRYQEVVGSSLPFIDLLFLNEYEAERLTGVTIAGEAGRFQAAQARKAAETILDRGVQAWVLIHAPQGVVAVSKEKEYLPQGGLKVPPEQIKGAVGAGDALAAGVLYGVHEHWEMSKSLALGVSVAAMSLREVTSTGGIKPWQECMALGKQFGYRKV